MRFRYFAITFCVLGLVSAAATYVNGVLLRQEREERIDVQLRETAAALLDSDINRVRHLSFDRVDAILSEELGETRVGKFFIIHDQYTGRKLFQSVSAKVLPLPEIPLDPQWLTYEINGKYVRVLNLKLPRIAGETLQVGLVLDESLVEPPLFSGRDMLYLFGMILFGLGISWTLSSWLMLPIRRLVAHVSAAAENPGAEVPPPFPGPASFGGRDEYAELVDSYRRLLSQIGRQQKLLRTWSYQMAHELKSPLALIKSELGEAMKQRQIPEPLALSLTRELLYASDTVTAFLTWAELDGPQATRALYATSARKALRGIEARLPPPQRERLRVEIADDFYVLGGLQHFEHLLQNLAQNALLYSPDEVRVASSRPGTITVADRGPGIPRAVLDRLGEPFNRGQRSPHGAQGHGLGLAYASSVCALHGWKLAVDSGPNGTSITVEFPPCEARPEPPQRLTETLPL